MVQIVAVQCEWDKYDEILNNFMPFMEEDKKNRIRKFVNKEDKIRTVIGDILARVVIYTKTKIKNEQIIFRCNEYGKPYCNQDIFFNISHAGCWVVCAVGDVEVGIDIEKIEEMDLSIAKDFFSSQENKDLDKKNKEDKLEYFYDLWTLKESYLKAWGRGLSIPLNSFTLRKEENHIKLITQKEFKNCYFKQYQIDKDYKLSLCAATRKLCEEILILNTKELYHKMQLYCNGG